MYKVVRIRIGIRDQLTNQSALVYALELNMQDTLYGTNHEVGTCVDWTCLSLMSVGRSDA